MLIQMSVTSNHGFISVARENYLIFKMTFWYLWIVIIIFPTFGLTTFHSIIWHLITDGTLPDSVQWQCMWNPETTAFFVELASSIALVTNALELLNPSGIVTNGFRVLFARTEVNVRTPKRRENGFGFGATYGENYLESYQM